MSLLILQPKDHVGLVTMAEGIACMRSALTDFASSDVVLSNPRTRTNTRDGFRMTVHQGVTPGESAACTHARAERVSIEQDGRQRYEARGHPTFILFDTETAALRMVMVGEPHPPGLEDVHTIAGFQTACMAVVGTDAMANPEHSVVGVLGSGGQAKLHLEGLAAARELAEVFVYSPTTANREAFAERMSHRLGVPVRALDDSREVVRRAELLLVCTNTNVPVLDGDDLREGAHVTSVVHSNKELLRAGLVDRMRQELDDRTLLRAAMIGTTGRVQEALDEAEVLYGMSQRGLFDWEDVIEVGDILAGKVSVSAVHRDRGITVFHNPGGWGIGAGAFIKAFYDHAREAGVGVTLDAVEGLEPYY
jgi:alanine dehydrogenase